MTGGLLNRRGHSVKEVSVSQIILLDFDHGRGIEVSIGRGNLVIDGVLVVLRFELGVVVQIRG